MMLLKKQGWKILLHISWIWMIFFSIWGFLLGAILFPTSVSLLNACSFGQKMFND